MDTMSGNDTTRDRGTVRLDDVNKPLFAKSVMQVDTILEDGTLTAELDSAQFAGLQVVLMQLRPWAASYLRANCSSQDDTGGAATS